MEKDRKKRNMIFCGLCIALIIMSIAYGIFRSTLIINGTTRIDTKWDVHIRDNGIVPQNAISATSTRAVKLDSFNAEFSCDLTTAGESTIDYVVTVENSGTLDAKLSSINLSGETNYIGVSMSKSSLKVNDVLPANGGTNTVTVTVFYKNTPGIPSASDSIANIRVTLNFIQNNVVS